MISINVTNKLKERYYHEYVPDLLDVGHPLSLVPVLRNTDTCSFPLQSLQDLSEARVSKLNSIWSLAAQLETSVLSRSLDQLRHLSSEIPRNNPSLDSMMFVRHNMAGWQEPPDMVFEPSPVWHDEDAMAVDESSKIFLRNVLGKSKGQLGDLRREVESKRRDIDGVKRIKQDVRAGKDKRDEVEIVRALISMQDELHQMERRRYTAEVEASTITSVVGDVSHGARNHNFKSQTFKIPTNCDLCGDRIWGLSAKGFDCRDCGYTCHSKCELKVPAECPGEQSKEEKKKLKSERQQAASVSQPTANGTPADGVAELPALSRSNTMNSLSSGYAASAYRSVSGTGSGISREEPSPDQSSSMQPVKNKPTTARKNRIVAPPPAQYVSELPSNGTNAGDAEAFSKSAEQRGKMAYAYQANGDGEITIQEGKEVAVLEPDGIDAASSYHRKVNS